MRLLLCCGESYSAFVYACDNDIMFFAVSTIYSDSAASVATFIAGVVSAFSVFEVVGVCTA